MKKPSTKAAAAKNKPSPQEPPPPAPVSVAESETADEGSSSNRIRWTFTEMGAVVDNVVARLRRQHLHSIPATGDRFGTELLNTALRDAQSEVLPQERRRAIIHRGVLRKDFWDMAASRLQAAIQKEELDKKAATVAAETVAPPPPPAPKIEDFADEEVIASAAVRLFRLFKAGKGSPLDLSSLEKAFAESQEVQQATAKEIEQLRNRLNSLPKTPASPPSSVSLPRVAIVGCRKDLFDSIVTESRKAGIAADFRHYEQDTKPQPFQADWCVMLRFASHAWEDHCKHAVPGGHYSFITGGAGMAVLKIEEWLKPAAVNGARHY